MNQNDVFDLMPPTPWWRLAPKYTPLELAQNALTECRREQLHHASRWEFHQAISRMLENREARLQATVRLLIQAANNPISTM